MAGRGGRSGGGGGGEGWGGVCAGVVCSTHLGLAVTGALLHSTRCQPPFISQKPHPSSSKTFENKANQLLFGTNCSLLLFASFFFVWYYYYVGSSQCVVGVGVVFGLYNGAITQGGCMPHRVEKMRDLALVLQRVFEVVVWVKEHASPALLAQGSRRQQII